MCGNPQKARRRRLESKTEILSIYIQHSLGHQLESPNVLWTSSSALASNEASAQSQCGILNGIFGVVLVPTDLVLCLTSCPAMHDNLINGIIWRLRVIPVTSEKNYYIKKAIERFIRNGKGFTSMTLCLPGSG